MNLKKYRQKTAALLSLILMLEPAMNLFSSMAAETTVMEITEFEGLDESVMFQTVSWGTEYEELNLPEYLKAEVVEVPADEDAEEEEASPSDAGSSRTKISTATSSDAFADMADDDGEDSGYRMVKIDWVLNTLSGGFSEYDGEKAGVYLFDAELASDKYILGDAVLPFIEVEVLEPDDTDEVVIEGEEEYDLSEIEELAPNKELLDAYVEQLLYGESGISLTADYGEDVLSGEAYTLYSLLKTWVKQVAAGVTTSTVLDLSDSCLSWTWTWDELGVTYTDNSQSEILAAVKSAFAEEIDVSMILKYVRRDCPYDMYWAGTKSKQSYSLSYNSSRAVYTMEQFVILPADDYAGEEEYTVDTTEIDRANTAVENAWEIAGEYADLSDYDKLTAFKEEICGLVSYNYDAAEKVTGDSSVYGDPWQIIYVFDGDEDTNVVCEGYSKAFQYLCDLSGFDECYTVTGTMTGGSGSGAHMWNLVRMDDITYLADITNSDSTTIGSGGQLFLVNRADAVASDSTGYSFLIKSTTITYAYDDDTLALYPADILTLSDKRIVIEDAVVTISGSYIYDGTEQIPDEENIQVELDGDIISAENGTNYTVSVTDNIDAGVATVMITGTGDYSGVATGTFTIEKAVLTISDLVLEDREYDGTSLVTVSNLVLDGLAEADGVNVDMESLVAAVSGADAGNYSSVTLSGFALTGDAADNYDLSQMVTEWEADVIIYAKTVTDPTIILSEAIYVYDGTEKIPSVTVMDGTVQIPSEEYAVSYENNVNSGTACVVITDRDGGNYNVSGTADFTIEGISLADAQVTVSGTYICDGEEQIPSADDIVVVLDGDPLSSENYVVAFSDNINAGTASVIITGAGNYTGTATGTFTIAVAAPILSSAENTTTGIKVSWNEVSGAVRYYVYRKAADEKSYTRIKATTHMYYTDTDVDDGVTYSYRIKTRSESLTSSYSNTMSYKWLERPVIASLANSSAGLELTWNSVDGATRYYVYRRAAGDESYTKIRTTAKTSYVDTETLSGTTYLYRVVAGNGSYVSANSASASCRRLEQTTISVISNTTSGLKVTWGAAGGASRYYIYRKASGESSYTKVRTTAKTSWTDTDVSNGVTYSYRVAAVDGSYLSAVSATTSYKRLTGITLSRLTNSGSGAMTVKWTANAKATRYQIQYSVNSDFSDYEIVQASSSKTSKVIAGLGKGKTYYVRIRCYYETSGKKYYSGWSSKKSVMLE